ncbi:FecR domain-containing protein [Maribacter sp.]|uniref:FecR protein domain-containing protein n=1 Tax=marine sediment metagenome TaxID=412755 RepID=A0A0F9V7Y6_9ZZZZ|nr:FecR domain-containing protein [Maribacter sp.]HDZ07436.1 FecR family protein [Maribacter sp.]HEA79871.1 FecR family protein [Maribacter sp.]|tara:strand:+ start:4816 stop:5979 length:1164 start_codon:yes stop_codon:yes gene_type:complete
MKNKKIEIILHKFLNSTATLDEIATLAKWVEKNKSSFQEEVELHHLITGAGDGQSPEHLKNNLIAAFDQARLAAGRAKKRNLLLRYAAIFIGFATLGIYTYLQTGNSVAAIEKEVTITLDDGSTKKTLNGGPSRIVVRSGAYVVNQEGTKITYKKAASNQKETRQLVYNTMDVPYGKKFQLVLSDGTEVYLNSGSSLTYPVAFYDQGPRNVVLRGEAYFTVTSDSLRPFTVSTQNIDAKVLGTEFNISSYQDDEHMKVVLVEGSLSVGQSNTSNPSALLLKPNQLVSYSYFNKELSKENVDVSSYIAWKDGVLLFKNEDFYYIAKKLERHYDVKIEIKDTQLSKERYTGRFKTETIEEILKAFQRIKGFDYTINEKRIKINPKKSSI